MDERANYKFPPIPGVPSDAIRECDADKVLTEVERLVLEDGDHLSEIARIFDASPESIQDEMRRVLKWTRYETY